jgi:hypothetical protein
MDPKDPRDPNNPDDVWTWVGPRAFVALLASLGFIYAGFRIHLVVGCVLVSTIAGWIAYCVRWSFTPETRDGNSRWYAFCERFGRPFHSL